MPTKNKEKNKQYVAKSRNKLKQSMGETAYKAKMAKNQREYRAKKKALKNPHIQDRKLRSIDVNELINIRKELKAQK